MKSLKDLQGKNIVVYDLEIKNVIDGKNVTWSTYGKMGISVGCLFDYETGDSHTYLDDNIDDLYDRLSRAEIITGYNIKGFDNPLIASQSHVKRIDLDSKSYDMLEHVRLGMGYREGHRYPSGCKLNDVLSATFGMQKTEDGADAPIFYQEKKMGKLISYCLADVRRERLAFEYAYLHGHLKTPSHGTHTMQNALEMLR